MKRFIFIAALIITGCAASGAKFSEPPKLESGTARIFIYRANAMQGKAWSDSYYYGSVEVASLKAGGYTYFTVKPGTYQITTGPAQHKLVVEINAIEGGEYFIRENPGSENLPREAFITSSDNRVNAITGGPIANTNLMYTSNVSWTDRFSQIKSEYAKNDLTENDYRYQAPVVQSLR